MRVRSGESTWPAPVQATIHVAGAHESAQCKAGAVHHPEVNAQPRPQPGVATNTGRPCNTGSQGMNMHWPTLTTTHSHPGRLLLQHVSMIPAAHLGPRSQHHNCLPQRPRPRQAGQELVTDRICTTRTCCIELISGCLMLWKGACSLWLCACAVCCLFAHGVANLWL